MIFKRLFFYLKTFLKNAFFYFKNIKRLHKLSNIEKKEEILLKINELGYKKVKSYKKYSWKARNGIFSFTYLGLKDSDKVIIKVSNIFDIKIQNSLNRINSLNFDFSPQFNYFKYKNLSFNISQFINHYKFLDLKYILKNKDIKKILLQLNQILDSFYENKLVHCDFVCRNIIIQKRKFKVIAIDYDTVFYGQEDYQPLTCKFLCYRKDNKLIFDDAYSVVWSLDKLNNKHIFNDEEYTKIKGKIGRHFYSTTL